ncbi:putative transcription factor C2H2 family [Helianthus annuus]|nr:putative transcription factor C2H2 family [Helianthus annuus]
MAGRDVIIIEDDDEDDEIILISDAQFEACSSSKQPLLSSKKRKRESKPLYSFCGICMDTKTASEMFDNTGICGHIFCSDCIGQHVAVKIKENVTKVKCPDPKCKRVIGPEACRSIVPKEVLERWESILCESVIMESQKFYCPFKDCSAMLVDDGGVAVTQSECPNCNRLFCAQCKVAWHCGISCAEFQSLKKGERNQDHDKLLIDLAKNKKWMKCPKCMHFVEKVYGCDFIACRCGHGFCYRCGQPCDHAAIGRGSHRCG